MKTNKEDIRNKVVDNLDMSREAENSEIYEIIDEIIAEETEYRYMSVSEKIGLHKYIFNSIKGLGILDELLEDEDITEIMINSHNSIFIEKKGHIYETEGQFDSPERLNDIIQQIVSRNNKRINESSPIADTRLPDGSRVNIVLPPVAIDGAVVTVRKFPRERVDMKRLIELKSITKEVADFLEKLVVSGYNIFICGGTGSGKTTFLNVLSDYIPGEERVITIEDSAELQLKNIKNIVRMEARQANTEGENEITIRDLIRTSLRMRPDRIIVGEVRGKEAIDMLQAMQTGHDGSMSTGHSNNTKDMLNRLETMVLMGMDIPMNAIRSQIASAIDIIVHLGRLRDRTRKVLKIDEVLDCVNGEIKLNPLFEFVEYGETEELVEGKLEARNRLVNTEKYYFNIVLRNHLCSSYSFAFRSAHIQGAKKKNN